MTITFSFNGATRSFDLKPDNNLEFAILEDMAMKCAKGERIDIKAIHHPVTATSDGPPKAFRVELVVKP